MLVFTVWSHRYECPSSSLHLPFASNPPSSKMESSLAFEVFLYVSKVTVPIFLPSQVTSNGESATCALPGSMATHRRNRARMRRCKNGCEAECVTTEFFTLTSFSPPSWRESGGSPDVGEH